MAAVTILANFKTAPLRSRTIMDSARGQPCTFEFVGVCNHDPETTVSAHIHDEQFGLATKADDTATAHACSSCHAYLDQGGWIGKISQAVLRWYIIRAILRTIRNRVERGIYAVKLDEAKPLAHRPTKPRLPKDQRRAIGGSRPIQSAGFDKTKTRKMNGAVVARRSEG